LESLPVLDAARVAGDLLRFLAVPSPGGFQTTSERASEIGATIPERQERLGKPICERFVDIATSTATSLATHEAARLVVHADLHYGNVLGRGDDAWAAIDPKPLSGDTEYSTAELMWTRLDDVAGTSGINRLLNTLIKAGHLDANLSMQWVVVRCVDYWLWGIEHGLTEDPVRCARILDALCSN
jgi:streptomycin 6-kinase